MDRYSKKFSPPILMLIDEHATINKVIAAIPVLADFAKTNFELVGFQLQDILYFSQCYIEKFHQTKEDDYLFKLFDEKTDIIAAMYDEHYISRQYLQKITNALEAGDSDAVSVNFIAYTGFMKEHIQKENNILFPWMSHNLTERQIDSLYSKFTDITSSFGEEIKNLIEFSESFA